MAKTIHDNIFKNLIDSTLSPKNFHRLSELIQNECGIMMPEHKKTLLESRLHKRLRRLKMSSSSEYCNYLFTPRGMKNELTGLIDVITTNKTDFFREAVQFDYLVQQVLPELAARRGTAEGSKLLVWSAGCSSGEEPYTLAIVLSEYSEGLPGNTFDFMLLGTDVCTSTLKRAKLGIYEHDRVDPVPLHLRKKYLLRSKDKKKDLVRIVPELRNVVKFRRLNFQDGDFGLREPVDIVFCRNVIIYFDKHTQERVLRRICDHMIPGGYIFMGHSETLNQLKVPLVQVTPTVYRKPL